MALERTKISSGLSLPETAPSRGDTWGQEESLRHALKRQGPKDEEPEHVPVDYPEMVVLLAVFEFLRAVSLVAVGTLSLRHPHAEWQSPSIFQLFFFMSNGDVSVSWMTVLTIVYAVTIGFALLAKAAWSRRLLMITSVVAVLRVSQYVATLSVIHMELPPAWLADAEFFREGALLLAAVNATVVIILRYAPAAAAWFAKES